jgi:hypothetical protein
MCKDDAEVRNLAGMDPEKLRLIGMQQTQVYGGPWQIVIVRKGYMVGEWFGVSSHAWYNVRRVVVYEISYWNRLWISSGRQPPSPFAARCAG